MADHVDLTGIADELELILEDCSDSYTIGQLRNLTIRLRGETDPYRPDARPFTVVGDIPSEQIPAAVTPLPTRPSTPFSTGDEAS